jgi:hypothetical protein
MNHDYYGKAAVQGSELHRRFSIWVTAQNKKRERVCEPFSWEPSLLSMETYLRRLQ